MIFGIDISKYQRVTDWVSVASKACFVWIRATLGYGTDYKLEEHYNGSLGVLLRGLYHVVWNSTEAPANGQLQHMLKIVEMYPTELPLMLDVERSDVGFSITEYLAKGYFDKTGKYPIIYTRAGWWNRRWNSLKVYEQLKYWETFAHCDLWTAHYGVNTPMRVIPWDTTHIHQFSQSGRIEGIAGNVDENHFFGTQEEFNTRYVEGEIPSPPTTEQILRVDCPYIWMRMEAEYTDRTKALVAPQNTKFLMTGDIVKEDSSGIVWAEVEVGYDKLWISTNSKLVTIKEN